MEKQESDLMTCMSDPKKLEAFRRFLVSDFSEENFAFFLDVLGTPSPPAPPFPL